MKGSTKEQSNNFKYSSVLLNLQKTHTAIQTSKNKKIKNKHRTKNQMKNNKRVICPCLSFQRIKYIYRLLYIISVPSHWHSPFIHYTEPQTLPFLPSFLLPFSCRCWKNWLKSFHSNKWCRVKKATCIKINTLKFGLNSVLLWLNRNIKHEKIQPKKKKYDHHHTIPPSHHSKQRYKTVLVEIDSLALCYK